ncbi:alpha/beta hydrolase [Rhodopseudomonas sp. AAP120]|nr:alpha/beta hydrolase [Rhodopseudomonas sp. AAP120]
MGRSNAATSTDAGSQPLPVIAGSNSLEALTVSSADGTKLTGVMRGDPQAPEILFIHGLRQSRLSWDKQFADPALASFRLVSFDLRGHGDSDKPVAPEAYADADRWADDVAAVIARAKLRRPVLVGWSLGGYVVGAYLRRYGGKSLAGINLVDAVTKLSAELLTDEAGAFTRTTTSHDLAERTGATADFLAACFHQQPAADEMRRMLVINGMTARAVNEGFIKTETSDLEPMFKQFAGPILLTHGQHDRLVRLAMSERIKALHQNSRLSVFDASGHSPFFEEPARYGRELADFVTAANKG